MYTIATTNNNNDIYIDIYNNIATKTYIYAIANICNNIVLTKYNELLYNQEKGIKYFDYIFSDDIDIPNFQGNIIEELEKVDGVIKVSNFKYEIKNKIFSYSVLIQTIFGEVELNG